MADFVLGRQIPHLLRAFLAPANTWRTLFESGPSTFHDLTIGQTFPSLAEMD